MQASEEEAMDSVFGYTVANDLSARDWQMKRYILARMLISSLLHGLSILPDLSMLHGLSILHDLSILRDLSILY
jgi:hypothetical protein